MRNAPCNVCGEHLCVCAKSLPDANSRTYQGMKLCAWATAGKLCNMIASGDQTHCNWHQEWKRQLEGQPMVTEYDALCEWLTQFAPGGDYGANPGQWWGDPQTTIQVCHGFGYMPARTEKVKYERLKEHWRAMEDLKRGMYSDKNQRLLARTKGESLEATDLLEKTA